MQEHRIPLCQLFPIRESYGTDSEYFRPNILFGNTQNTGILNHPEIPRIIVKPSENSDVGVTWYNNISHALQAMANLTAEVESPDSILLPPKASLGLYSYLLLETKNVKCACLPELSSEFMSHGNSMLLYKNDPSKIEVFIEQRGVRVIVYRPLSLLLMMGV